MTDLDKPKGVWGRMHEEPAPIVTIFGAGIAGLTAAHELVERGFAVQVVEQFGHVDDDGTVHVDVGGMARNAPCRMQPHPSRLFPQYFPEAAEAAQYRAAVRDGRILDEDVRKALGEQDEEDKKRRDDGRKWILRELYQKGFQPLHPMPRLPGAITPERFGEDFVASLGEIHERYGDDPTPEQRKEIVGAVRERLLHEIMHGNQKEIERIHEAIASAWKELDAATGDFEEREGLEDWDAAERSSFLEDVRRRFTILVEMHVHGGGERPPYLMQLFAHVLREAVIAVNGDDRPFIPHIVTQVVILGPTSGFTAEGQADSIDFTVLGHDVSCEHGYRFFPSCYRHLFDTMRRTPILVGGEETYRTAFDRLRPSPSVEIALQDGQNPESIPRKAVYTLEELRLSLEVLMKRLGLSARDMLRWDVRMLKFMTSCAARRREYENQSWWQFIGGPGDNAYSKKASRYIMRTPKALLGVAADHIDARTHASMSVQLLLDHMPPAAAGDSTLVGPTSETWLEPWKTYLKEQGVRFFLGRVNRLLVHGEEGKEQVEPEVVGPDDGKCPLSEDGDPYYGPCDSSCGDECSDTYEPSFYVLALSYMAAANLVNGLYGTNPGLRQEGDFARLFDFDFNMGRHRNTYRPCPGKPPGPEPQCEDFVHPSNDSVHCELHPNQECDASHVEPPGSPNVHDPANPLRDLVGVQYYFQNQVRVGKGHVYYPDAPWGLSSISQFFYWRERPDPGQDFLGQVSVDVGDLDTPYASKKDGVSRTAWRSTAEEIAVAVWHQVMDGLSGKYGEKMEEPRFVHIDRGLKFYQIGIPEDGRRTVERNVMPYFAPLPCQWRLRPGFRGVGAFASPHDPPYGKRGHSLAAGRVSRGTEIFYNLSHGRWLLAGTHMATYTRLTTMEAANESGRHAVHAILHRVMETKPEDAKYHGAGRLMGEMPDIWDPEENELRDLDPLKRLDELLFEENLPHFLDILGVIDETDKSSARASVAARARQVAANDWDFAAGTLETLLSARPSQGTVNPELERLRKLMEEVVGGAMKGES